jgi:hypothetical protein
MTESTTTFEWPGDGTMRVTRGDIFGGGPKTMSMPAATEKQVADFGAGEKVQKAFPQLNRDQCEFILNGLTPELFEEIHKHVD